MKDLREQKLMDEQWALHGDVFAGEEQRNGYEEWRRIRFGLSDVEFLMLDEDNFIALSKPVV